MITKDKEKLSMFLTGALIVAATSIINLLPQYILNKNLMWMFGLMFTNESLYYALLVLMLIPVGSILSSIAGNKTTGILTFAISGVYYIIKSTLPSLFIAFFVVVICTVIYDTEKINRTLSTILTVLFIAIVGVSIGAATGKYEMFKYLVPRYILLTGALVVVSVLIGVAIEQIPILKRFDERSKDIDTNFRVHSINRKLMFVINVICILLVVLFSVMSVVLISQENQKKRAAEERIWESIFYSAIADDADIYGDHDMEAIKAEADKFRDAIGMGHIEVPAYVVITTNYDGTYIKQYYEITRPEIYGDYSYDVKWINELEVSPEEAQSMILAPSEGNSSLIVKEQSTVKEAAVNAVERILSVALVLMVLMNLLAEIFIRKNIVRPINQMTTEALEFAFGDYDALRSNDGSASVKTRVEIRSGDEIESLSRAFHKTMDDVELYIESIKEKSEQVADMQHNIIITMADIIESRDHNTGGHIKRTALYVGIIARKLMEQGQFADVLTKDYLDDMIVAAPLHDMGKIHVPDEILNKKGPLSDDEYEIMKTHATVGKGLLDDATESLGEFKYLVVAKQMAECHHEWWNGNGYPRRIAGEDIPLCARIMAVADVFDALVSKRCYKEPMDLEVAFGIIQKETGTHFDPIVAKAFMDSRPEVEATLAGLEE